MINRAARIAVGDHVTYLPGCGPTPPRTQPAAGRDAPRRCVHGRVVAPPVSDPYAAVVWLPTRPDGAAADTEPTWVRHDRVVDITHRPAASGEPDDTDSPAAEAHRSPFSAPTNARPSPGSSHGG